MQWNHLPESGGLYNQHPKVLDDFYYIFGKRAEYEAKKHAEEQRKQRPSMGAGKGKTRGRRRR